MSCPRPWLDGHVCGGCDVAGSSLQFGLEFKRIARVLDAVRRAHESRKVASNVVRGGLGKQLSGEARSPCCFQCRTGEGTSSKFQGEVSRVTLVYVSVVLLQCCL